MNKTSEEKSEENHEENHEVKSRKVIYFFLHACTTYYTCILYTKVYNIHARYKVYLLLLPTTFAHLRTHAVGPPAAQGAVLVLARPVARFARGRVARL